jgi:chromosome segregation ATPase
LGIKSTQLTEFDSRLQKSQDELDLVQYKLQEQQKEMTEMRLKTDVLTSTNDGLLSEKTHLTVELKETRALAKSYEAKTNELMATLSTTTTEFQALKRGMISYDEMTRVREERIAKLKGDLDETGAKLEGLELAHGTLQIQHAKVSEQKDTAVTDLADTTEKLHVTNKVRHETEIKLAEEVENGKQQRDILKLNNETLSRKTAEMDDLDKRLTDLQRTHEALDTKKQGIERQFELSKKQLNEKIGNLNDIIDGEKTTRDMWIERYEKEQREHSTTNAQYLQCKSELRD